MLQLWILLNACKPECGTIRGEACVDTDPGTEVHEDTGPTKPLYSSSTGGWTDIAAGYWHTCGVDADGHARCWGWDADGETDPPDTIESDTVEHIGAGWYTSCALTNGNPTCWGYDSYVGVSTYGYDALSVGAYHQCFLGSAGATQGTVRCEFYGPADSDQGQETAPEGAYISVAAGEFNTCALDTSGAAVCWGAGAGEGGADDHGQSLPPAGVYASIAAGPRHGCALDVDGSAVCWGDDTLGAASPPAGTFTAITAGNNHTCALDADGRATCWGDDASGQSTPPDAAFAKLSAGGDHTCGLDTDGVVRCWGDGEDGQTVPP